MVPVLKIPLLVQERTPDRACLDPPPAGADFFSSEVPQVPLDLTTSDQIRLSREKVFEQGRTAAPVAAYIDELCQCRACIKASRLRAGKICCSGSLSGVFRQGAR